MNVYIRPLQLEDAMTSYMWRNNSIIWQYTGNRPDRLITPEIEKIWLLDALNRKDEKRFAICVEETDKYIGNVQLTHIENGKAQFHIFIGEQEYWGYGLAKQATFQILDYGFEVLKLEEIYLNVKKDNIVAVKLYEKCGFKISSNTEQNLLMTILRNER